MILAYFLLTMYTTIKSLHCILFFWPECIRASIKTFVDIDVV